MLIFSGDEEDEEGSERLLALLRRVCVENLV